MLISAVVIAIRIMLPQVKVVCCMRWCSDDIASYSSSGLMARVGSGQLRFDSDLQSTAWWFWPAGRPFKAERVRRAYSKPRNRLRPKHSLIKKSAPLHALILAQSFAVLSKTPCKDHGRSTVQSLAKSASALNSRQRRVSRKGGWEKVGYWDRRVTNDYASWGLLCPPWEVVFWHKKRTSRKDGWPWKRRGRPSLSSLNEDTTKEDDVEEAKRVI
jgi:hypothetical protein